MKIISKETFLKEQESNVVTEQSSADIDSTVLEIIKEVKENGDQALQAYTKKFDGVTLEEVIVSKEEFAKARTLVSEDFINALRKAQENIKAFHENQVEKSWFINPEEGVMLGQRVTPIESVGLYVPGGTAAYPSSVLMNAVPAKIAGVPNIAITTPPQADGSVNPYVLVAAEEAGVDLVYKIGGAQSIAALAYGTESVIKVEKIVGPGNAYVACAKKWVFGDVAIDMIAGPSEITVVADETAIPRFVAADLLSQAEHDEKAVAICITTSDRIAQEVQQEVVKQTKTLSRREMIETSLRDFGRIIQVDKLSEAFELVNQIAPEHLQLMIENPFEEMVNVKNAGAIFLGNYSAEALGDYMAGPNHTLPTSGTATFSSPLGVYDFIKRSSIIQYSEAALQGVADEIMTIANAERLTAHAEAINKRKDE